VSRRQPLPYRITEGFPVNQSLRYCSAEKKIEKTISTECDDRWVNQVSTPGFSMPAYQKELNGEWIVVLPAETGLAA
jgi:hypothetical protein